MAEYGNWIVQNEILPAETIEKILIEQMPGFILSPVFDMNRPCEFVDPETGKTISGFISSWRAHG